MHAAYQRLVERLFFGGRSTRLSEAVSLHRRKPLPGPRRVLHRAEQRRVRLDGRPVPTGFHLNTALDNLIPFVPEWAIFYLYLFYPLSALTMAWFALVDYRRGYPLAFSLVLINLVADIVYVVFPVTTDIYRAALLAHPMVGKRFCQRHVRPLRHGPVLQLLSQPARRRGHHLLLRLVPLRGADGQQDRAGDRHRDARRRDRRGPLHAVRQAALHRGRDCRHAPGLGNRALDVPFMEGGATSAVPGK